MNRREQTITLSRLPSNESDETHLVFVYGSLMRGYSNHRLLERGRASYLGRATTRASYTLVDLVSFPGMLEGGHTRVRGEVYQIDSATLAHLDRLEGHPRFYQRKRVALGPFTRRLRTALTGSGIWTYVLPAEEYGQRPEIPSGDWRMRKPPERAP